MYRILKHFLKSPLCRFYSIYSRCAASRALTNHRLTVQSTRNPWYKYIPSPIFPLELVHLILRIPQLGQNPGQLALVLRTRLRTANRLVQSWWSTHKYLDVFLLWFWQHRLQQLLVNEPLPVRPALRRLVQGIEGPEAVRVLLLKLFKFTPEKDVLFSDVAEDEGDLGFFVGIVEDFADQLVHWRDSGAASNERDV